MAATRIRISKQLGKSTTPRSLVYTDLSNEQAYFVPPSGGDFVLMWDDSATDLSWLSTSSLINIYNNDGTISGTRNVDFSNPLNFNYDDGVINTSQLALQDSLTFNTSEAGTGSSILTVSPTIVSLAVNNVSVDTGSGVNVQPNLVRLYAEHNTTTDNVMLDITNQTGVISSTYSGFQGLRYFADYSANFTSLSLITKGYLDGIIATLPSSNIYTDDGALLGNRILTGDGFNLNFQMGSGTYTSNTVFGPDITEIFLQDSASDYVTTQSLTSSGVYQSWENTNTGESSTLNIDELGFRFSRFVSGSQKIVANSSGIIISDDELNQGAEYEFNHAAYFATNPRSIPDVGYVNTLVSGISQPLNQIVYGTGSSLSSEADFTYVPSTNRMTVGAITITDVLDTGTPYAAIKLDRTLTSAIASSAHGVRDSTIFSRPTYAYAAFDAAQTTNVAVDHNIGFQARNVHSTSTVVDLLGFGAYPSMTGGTATNVKAYEALPILGTGLTTNYYAFIAKTPTGTATNMYGLYVESLSGSSSYSVYTAGATPSLFGGTVYLNAVGSNMRMRADGTTANDAGIYVSAAGTINFGNWDSTKGFIVYGATGNIQQMSLGTAQLNRTGINTTPDATAALNVSGTSLFSGTATFNSSGANIRLRANGTTTLDGAILVNNTGNIFLSNWDANRGIVVKPDNNIYTLAGSFGITVTSPTARLHLPVGTTVASSAPLKFTTTSAALTTVAEAGAMEVSGDRIYYTQPTGPIRQTLAYLTDVLWTDSGAFTYLTSTSDRLVLGSSTELNSNYSLQINGGATFRNAVFTSNESNNGFLDIRGGTLTAQAGSTHTLSGINVEGTMVFNNTNQTFTGIRVSLTSNATASQFIIPLDIVFSSASIGSSRLLNSNATNGSELIIGGNTVSETIIIRSPNGGTSGGAIPGISYKSSAGSFSWNIGAQGGNKIFSIQTSSTSNNPNSVNSSFFIKDTRTFIGTSNPNFTPSATLHVRGEASTSGTFTAQFHNSTGSNNAFVIRDDGNVGISTNSPTQPLDVNGNARFRSGLYDGSNSIGSADNILTSTGSATQWKSLSTLSIPTGTGAATRVAFWTGTNTLSNDGAFVWDNTNKKVTIGNYTMAAGFNIQGRGQINPGGFTPVSGTNILLDIGANPTSTGVNNVALYGIRAAPVLINDGTPTGNSMYAIQTTASVSNPTKADIVAAFNAGGSNTSPNLSQFYGIYGRIDEKTSSVTNLANRSALRFDMVKSDTGAGIDGHYGSAMAVNCSDFSTGGRWLQGTGISMSVTNAKLSWGVTIATSNTRGTGNVVRGISINSVASNAGTVVDTVYGVELALGVSSGAVITDYYGISFTGIPAGTNARFLYNTTTASNRLGGITSIGAADPVTSNSLTIRGLGTTSSTFGLQVHNSSGSNNAFVVRDDGKVGILTGNPTQALDINGGARFRGEFYDYANSPGTSGDILTSFGPGVGAVWQSLSLLNIPTGSGTAGQITYYTSGSVLGSENGSGANAFTWDSTNNRMGVRTSAPTSAIEVRGDSLGVIQTTTDGYAAANTTAATSGNQQISPAFRWRGNGWKTNATAASQSVEFRAYVIPVQGAAAPTGRLCWGSAIAGTWTDDQIVFTSAGTVGIGVTGPTAKLHLAAGSTAANSAPIKLTSGSLMTTPEIGSFEFLTDRLYFTQTTSSTRQTIAYLADLSTVNTLYTSSGSLTGARTVTLGTNLLEFTGSSGAGKLMFAKIDPSTNIHLKSQDTSGVDPLLSEIVMSTTSLTLGLGDSSIFSTETTYLTFSGAGTSLNYGGHEILLDASGVYLTEAGGLGWQYSNDYSVTVLDNNRSIPDIFTVRENNVENYTTISSTTSPIDLSGLPPDFLIAQGATQATFTFNLPASPKNGQICKLTFSTAVTALTIGAQGGLTILGTTATTAAVGTQLEYKFYQSISAWVRVR